MKRTLSIAILMAVFACLGTWAQVVTTSPAIVQTDSRNIIITFHANEGNKGLEGISKSSKVYAHTGVITNLSTSGSDWKYAPSWLDNSAKYELTWVSSNTWNLTIPDIRSYYGITNPAEVVQKLAFVFRNADGSRKGKTASGGDIFVDVVPAGFAMDFTCNLSGNILTDSRPVTFTANSTLPADISIYVDTPSNTLASQSGVTTLSATTTLSLGEHTVYAVGKNAGNTITQKIGLIRVEATSEQPYPGGVPKMGPVASADGSVTFCIAAPQKSSVLLVGSWNNYTIGAQSVMHKHDYNGNSYFWTTIPALANGTNQTYYFVVDGQKYVCDPYARLVLDPWNDQYIPSAVYPDMPQYPSAHVSGTPVAVYNSAMDSYNWQVPNFVGAAQSDLVIYELLIRDFTGTEGEARGNGTIEGVIEKLDYIKSLGVNAVELMPIMEFNGNNSWGYNTNFYFAPDKAYGTPNDYRRLIDEIHARGMAVILDIVFNQSDGLHPWYMMYDIARNPFYNGSAPHAYSVLNDWNQDNPIVQQQWYDALQYWLTAYKVDGFRFDLVKGLGNNNSYGATYNAQNNTWANVTDAGTNNTNFTRVERMKQLHDAMRAVNPRAYFINENLAGAIEENAMAEDSEINWANINNASCQFAMGWSQDASLNRFYAPYDSRMWGSTVSYAESHDEERMAYKQNKYGAAGVKGNVAVSMRRLGSVAAQMLLAPGAHMIWQFQEFGADQTTKNDYGNDTSPKTVIWSQLNDPDRAGLKQNYTELCHLRTSNPEMFTPAASVSLNFSAWDKRTLSLKVGSKTLWLVVNPSTTATVEIPTSANLSAPEWRLLSASYDTAPQASAEGVTLAPGAYAVYGTAAVAGQTDIDSDIAAGTRVYGGQGCIVVEGSAEGVEVFTVSGLRTSLTNLAPGLYIVKTPNASHKVAVR